jgi:hypothetical protein
MQQHPEPVHGAKTMTRRGRKEGRLERGIDDIYGSGR